MCLKSLLFVCHFWWWLNILLVLNLVLTNQTVDIVIRALLSHFFCPIRRNSFFFIYDNRFILFKQGTAFFTMEWKITLKDWNLFAFQPIKRQTLHRAFIGCGVIIWWDHYLVSECTSTWWLWDIHITRMVSTFFINNCQSLFTIIFKVIWWITNLFIRFWFITQLISSKSETTKLEFLFLKIVLVSDSLFKYTTTVDNYFFFAFVAEAPKWMHLYNDQEIQEHT